tara:strand:- start:6020 stop:7048 length:1029 start_codon:yes stop_codon:yes gene_type:complete
MNKNYINLLIDISLVGFFFIVCLGLGYGVLTRFDPTLLPALVDAHTYSNIVQNGISTWHEDGPGVAHRVFVPSIARIVYLITPPIGSWNMVSFSLLVVNSLFTSFSALFILKMSYKFTNKLGFSMAACLIFLLNFNIVNSYLVSSVDAAYGFFFLLLIYCMHFNNWKWIPLIAVVGCLTKEAFLPVGSSLIFSWLIYEFHEDKRINKIHLGIFIIFVLLCSVTTMLINSYVTQSIYLPWDHLSDRTLWIESKFTFSSFFIELVKFTYTIGWLLVLAAFSLKYIPKKIVFSSLIAGLATVFMGWWVNAGGADYARFIYSPAALVISIACGISLTKILQKSIQN